MATERTFRERQSIMSINIRAKDTLQDTEENVFRLVQIDIKLKEIRDYDRTKSPCRLTGLIRANNVTIFALFDSLYRIVISAGESRYDRLNVPVRTGDQIDRIFLDHTGYHCIISLREGT
jgi:hypothetical protein